jgi:hypothetical protein
MELTKGDYALLGEAQRSNGGGIRCLPSNGKMIGRLMALDLLAPKKGNVTSVELYVITRKGREVLRDRQLQEQNERNDQIMRGAQPEVFRNVVDHVERLNQPRTVILSTPSGASSTFEKRFFDPVTPPAQPWDVDPGVIDVEFKEVPDGQDQTPCDPPWTE